MKVWFEDNHLLIVEKAAGLLTQETDVCKESLENNAKAYLKKDPVFLKTVHRLDKDVSGIVMFTRSSKATERMSHAIKQHEVKKQYIAEVEGDLIEDEGELTHYLLKCDFHAQVFDKEHKGAKKCSLKFWVHERKKHSTIIEIELETGRYHQIRAQFSHLGHPIVGDQKYKSVTKSKRKGIHLHHSHMTFIHPTLKEQITITSADCGF